MVYERVTNAVSEATVYAPPDRRWLGMLLCAISAALTLTLGAVIANSMLSTADGNMVTDEAPAFERFGTAAGHNGGD